MDSNRKDDIASGKPYGMHLGKVVYNNDPELLGRIKIYFEGLSNELLSEPSNHAGLPWSWQMTPPSYGHQLGDGNFSVPKVGTIVWAQFYQGSLNHPIYIGSFSGGSGGKNSIDSDWNSLARGVDPELEVFGSELDPTTEFNPVYPNNSVIGFNGCSIEYDATEGEERIQFTHKNKSYIKISKSGIHLKSTGEKRENIIGNAFENVGGNKEEVITGSKTTTADSITQNGPFTQNGETAINGDTVITGTLQVTKLITADGDIIFPTTGVKLGTHKHTGVQTGGGSSGPPTP